MSKWLVVRKLYYSGDVDNIYILEAGSENEAIGLINDDGGLVSIAVNLDTVKMPYRVFKDLGNTWSLRDGTLGHDPF